MGFLLGVYTLGVCTNVYGKSEDILGLWTENALGGPPADDRQFLCGQSESFSRQN